MNISIHYAMNYLKKKLKLSQKPKHEDDDDYDNYIPPVPPHPSTLVAGQVPPPLPPPPLSTTLGSSVITQSNGDPSQPLPAPAVTDEPPISSEELFKQLKEKEFIRRQEEKALIAAQEKDKQNREDWKFFLNLTAKVEDITNKTQSALEKLKDTSAVDDIVNQVDEGLDYVPEPDIVVVKSAGSWVAFTEDGQPPQPLGNNLEVFGWIRHTEDRETKPSKTPQQITEESLKKVAEEAVPETIHLESSQLLDDFGFNKEPEVIPVAYQPVLFEEEDYLDDPFDTSFVNVSTVAPKAAAELIL
ncbi:unnamed protein product, partial [Medioppia subpectinata]